jgi:hypothetical protein
MIRFLFKLAVFILVPIGLYAYYFRQTLGPIRAPLSFPALMAVLEVKDARLIAVLSELDTPTGEPRVAEMIKLLAPQLTLHPNEHYFPTDPLHFVERSELHQPKLSPDPIPYAIGDLKKGYPGFELHPTRIDPGQPPGSGASTPPALWRLSHHPVTLDLQPTIASKNSPEGTVTSVHALIEYWFHYDYNDVHLGGPFNHDGDWESVSLLVEISANSDTSLPWRYRPMALFMSQHEYGQWICMTHRPDLFTALGTHATYENNGLNPSGLYIDRTGQGVVWDTSKNLRPLVREPYYGYEGLWGGGHWFEFNRAPEAPNPRTKTTPKRRPKWEAKALAGLRQRCGL